MIGVTAQTATVSAGTQLWQAGAVTIAFTLLARLVKGVSVSGAAAGAVTCFLLYAGAGAGAFAALVSVFALTWITTRLGYRRKQASGLAENTEGRSASQVMANLAVAAGCAGFYSATGKAFFLLAVAAALSEAAADTVSSELGQARSNQARLITTWELVPSGTDGGVTLVGTLSGIAAAILVSVVCFSTRLIPLTWLVISIGSATIGMIADSYMGALLERRGLLNNDAVNLLGTIIAAGIAIWLS